MTLSPAVVALSAGLYTTSLQLPPAFPPTETDEEYRARVAVINVGAAIVATEVIPEGSLFYQGTKKEIPTEKRIEARWRIGNALLSLTYGETRWAEDLHSGARRGDFGKAACLGQLHETASLPAEFSDLRIGWAALSEGGTDLEATTACLRQTWVTFYGAFKYCKSDWTVEGLARAYTLYGTGAKCEPRKWAKHRAMRWQLMVNGKKPTGIASIAFLGSELGSASGQELPSLLPAPGGEEIPPWFLSPQGLRFSRPREGRRESRSAVA